MTKIEIVKKNGSIVKLKAEGHTNYGVEGEDIVCAAASSIMQTAVLGILVVAGVDAKVKRDEKKALLEFTLTANHDTDVILNTMLLGLSDLREGYSDFIEIELKGE